MQQPLVYPATLVQSKSSEQVDCDKIFEDLEMPFFLISKVSF
jgi:hypothetical protein